MFAACSPGLGQAPGPDASPPDPAPLDPVPDILFPPAQSVTDASTMTMRGTAPATAGDAAITAVSVNGVPAILTPGAPGQDPSWQVELDLSPGINTLRVTLEADDGTTWPDAAHVVVMRKEIIARPGAVAWDSDKLVIWDRHRNTIVEVDPDSDSRRVVRRGDNIAGHWAGIEGMALDTQNGRVLAVVTWVLPVYHLGLVAIDLSDGTETILYGAPDQDGVMEGYSEVRNVIWDPAKNRVIVTAVIPDIDIADLDIYMIDLTTNIGTRISRTRLGQDMDGITIDNPMDAALDTRTAAPADSLLLLDQDELLAVDMNSGVWTRVLDFHDATLPALHKPSAMMADENRVLLVDYQPVTGGPAIMDVDMSTGSRTIRLSRGPLVSDTGHELSHANDAMLMRAVHDQQQDRLLVGDPRHPGYFILDLNTGALVHHAALAGSGPPVDGLWKWSGPVLESDRILAGARHVFAIDERTGARSILSTDSTDNVAMDMRALTMDAPNQRILAASVSPFMVAAVDLVSGARTLVTEQSAADPVEFQAADALALEPGGSRILALNRIYATLFAVDLGTDERSIVSASTVGSGPAMRSPIGMIVDTTASAPAVFVSDRLVDGILEVDLASGDRRFLSTSDDANQPAVGTGPSMLDPVGMALDAGAKRLLVAAQNDLQHTLFSVDLATGDRTVLSRSSDGKGPDMLGPIGVAFDAGRGVAIVADKTPGMNSFLIVDTRTGERVLLSR